MRTGDNRGHDGTPGLSGSLPFYLGMTAAMALWGGSWVSAKWLASATFASRAAAGIDAPPELLTFWRFFLTLISLLPLLPRSGWRIGRASLGWTALSAPLLILYNLLFFGGVRTGLAGKGGVIVTTLNPLFGFLLAILFLGQRPRPRQLAGLALGVVGGVILMEPWVYSLEELVRGGNLLFLAAASVWATLTVFSHKAQRVTGPVTYSFWLYLIALVPNLLLASRVGAFSHPSLSRPDFWWNMAYLSLGATTVATTLYFAASRRVGSARAGTFTFLVPLFAVSFSWMLLGEVPRAATLVGGALALTAVTLIQRYADERA